MTGSGLIEMSRRNSHHIVLPIKVETDSYLILLRLAVELMERYSPENSNFPNELPTAQHILQKSKTNENK